MHQEQLEHICDERFKEWTKLLVGEHATPIFALGVGHGDNSGTPVICMVDFFSVKEMADMLRSVADNMERMDVEHVK